jgi:hypothetical protein
MDMPEASAGFMPAGMQDMCTNPVNAPGGASAPLACVALHRTGSCRAQAASERGVFRRQNPSQHHNDLSDPYVPA